MSLRDQSGRRKTIVVAGSVMLDLLIAPLAHIPRWDENVFVRNIRFRLGGLAANAAVCLSRLGVPVDLLACVGADSLGDMLREQLKQAGVNCRYLRRDPTYATSLAFGFVGEHGQRLFVVSQGANARLRKRDFQRVSWKDCGLLHLGGFFHLPGLEPHLPALLSSLRRRGIQTSLDLAWDPQNRWLRPLRPVLRHLDFIFPNDKQVQRLTKERDVRRGAAALRAGGVRNVVVKLGARGCYLDADNWKGFVPAFPVRVRDTTGAGDNFDAAFLYGLRNEWGLETCARFANVVAAASTRAYGAAAALPSPGTAVKWMKSFYPPQSEGSSSRRRKLSSKGASR